MLTSIRKINLDKKNKKIQFQEIKDAIIPIGTTFSPVLEYKDSQQTELPEGFVVKPVTESFSKLRLGLEVVRVKVQETQTITNLGSSFKTVTSIGEDDFPKDTFNIRKLGKDLTNYLDKSGLTPVITAGNRIDIFGDIDHFVENTCYGQGSYYKIYDEDYNFIPFEDFSQLIPQDLMGKRGITAYPFVYTNRKNFSQYVDPSIPGNDGSIDVFETRNSLTNLSILDKSILGFKCNLMGGGNEFLLKDGLLIEDVKEVKNGKKDYFLDSCETLFEGFLFPQVGVVGSSGKVYGTQGWVSQDMYELSPFEEGQADEVNEGYDFLTSAQKSLLLNDSNRNISEIGTRFKSSTCGFLFGESNILGTDSISFGGLKK